MKFFIAIAVLAVAASARILPADINLTPNELAEVEEILAAIHSPSTDPTTAAMLEQMLYDLLGIATPVKPPISIPAIVDEFVPPHASPAIIDFPVPEGAIPVDVPATPVAPAAPVAPSASPLVQIIVNVNQDGSASPNPVQVDNVQASPVVVVDKPEVAPTPVHVVDHFEVEPTPVHVVDEMFEVQPEPVVIGHLPEPVNIAPIVVAPAVVGPETLN